MASHERGTVIAGKYRVERVIGQGGMGVVLAARHLGLDEMVAVKLIREERAEAGAALARFQREARAAARIKSEHVARVLDVDRLPEGSPYIVMELIDGTDLHALVKRRGTLPPDEAISYIVQACEGLAEAHAFGMVHRDLKLKNLFLTKRRDGRALIKVIDFGVVKFSPLGDDDDAILEGSTSQLGRQRAREATLTGAAVLVGSVHYMAPEQIRASNVVNAQADVWSLGVCLYTMLTGALPFDGETVAAVCAAIQGRPPRDLRELAPHVHPDIASAVMRALEKDVRRRFANVGELAAAIAPHGPDHAAPVRIEAILQSDVRSNAGAFVLSSEPDRGSTVTSGGGLPGRVESTIDAAAVGSLASHAAPSSTSSTRWRWLTGVLVAVGVGAVTLAVWSRPPASVGMRAEPMTATPPAPVPAPTSTPTPTVEHASAPPVETTSAAPAPSASSPPPRPTAKRPPRVPKPAPSPPSAATPKPESSSAYDQF